MKKVKILIVLCFSLLVGVVNVNASKNPYKQSGPYGTNCTWYAWQQAHDKVGVSLPGWGNAKKWYSDAQKSGYQVGSVPRAKSIVVWENWTEYGHVGYVERVDENYIYVWDSTGGALEYIEPQFSECILASPCPETDKPCYENYTKTVAEKYGYKEDSRYKILGYIYLDVAPTKPSNTIAEENTTSVNNETTKEETPKKEVKKSNNANLSSLKIDNIDLEFKKDTLKYELEVENAVESIKINAKTENKKAKIESDLEQKLEVGINIIEIKVLAEDETTKIYTLEIKRKDNNTNLSSLTISDIEFTFDKEKLEYELEVNNEINEIEIDGILESETSSIEGLGKHSLNEGDNKITLLVKAEDNTEKTYTFKIKRNKKVEVQEEKKSNQLLILYLIIGFCALIASAITTIIILKKKNKRKKTKGKKGKKVKK